MLSFSSNAMDVDRHDMRSAVGRCAEEPNPDMAAASLVMPPNGMHPKEFMATHFDAVCKGAMNLVHGTTTLAFIYEGATPQDHGGIIIAVDSRATGGQHISSKSVMKILDIADHMVATMAGGAADCQFWVRFLGKYCSLYELREKERISVAAASKYMCNVLYGYKGRGLSVGSMIAGYDKTGAKLYLVDNDGSRVPGKMFSVGSGSIYAYGILDTFYKPKMTDEEARTLGKQAIAHATYRDCGSGGSCNMVHITPTSKIRFDKVDVDELTREMHMGNDNIAEEGVPGV